MASDWYSGQNHFVSAHRALESLISYVDDAVRKHLPSDCKVLSITPHGKSFFGQTARIVTLNANGEEISYFIKVHQGADQKDLVAGEHHAMTIMHEVMSNFVPKPIAHGCYDSVPDAWFYLCGFRDMVEVSPDVAKDAKFVAEFSRAIAELHERATNPEGKFGWPFFVFAGRNPRVYPLSHSWEETFTEGLRRTFDIEEMAQGPDKQWTQLRNALFEKVIPRLLRLLQTEGRNVAPTLINGDLWHGNVGIDANTRGCVIYDPSPMFAHHEAELGPWYCPRHRIDERYIVEYLKHRHKSEPQEDFYDWLLLYSIQFDVQSSSNYPGHLERREFARKSIQKLVHKFPDGYEG